MSGLFATRNSVQTTPANPQIVQDIEVANPPSDSISSIAFSKAPHPQGDYFAVGSWDNNVRIYEFNSAYGQTQGKAIFNHDAPVLDVCWNTEGNKVFSASTDKTAKVYDMNTGQSLQVAAHDAPIKAVRWADIGGGILVTGSWDKTVKYWDLRASTPIATVQVQDRVYAMDVQSSLLVVATAERHIQVINLNNPTTIAQSLLSPLKWQTRTVSCFSTGNGYAIGSVEGRVAIQFLESKNPAANYTFRCHREDNPNKTNQLVFSVNAINFHHSYGTFSTAGSDGTISFWDRDNKVRLKTFNKQPGPIAATAFNKTGNIFAYAVSYDWSKGYSGMIQGQPNKIMLHACTEDEIKRKAKN